MGVAGSDVLFDKYRDEVDVRLFEYFLEMMQSFQETKIREFLYNYYVTNEKKEVSVNSLDHLLHYVLTQFEVYIRDQSNLVETAEEVINCLC